MKLGNPANYFVQVWPSWWDEPAETAASYTDIFALSINAVVTVKFVPDVGSAAPPWRFPAGGGEPSTAEEVRVVEALTGQFAVTPNAALAGRVDEFTVGQGDPPNTVFYVTAEDFAAYRDDLASLAETAGGSLPKVRHDDVADLAVVRFLDAHVLGRISADVVARG